MRQDITHYVTKVCPCLKSKKPPINAREPLHRIVTTPPFQMVAIDYFHLETRAGGYQYILVVMDHFTRYAQAYATRDKSAKTAADKLYNDFIPRYGFPQKIHHGQGTEFENKLFYNLEKLSGIKHSRTTPYHPEGNGQVERFNRTSCQCFVPYQLNTKAVGVTISTKSYTHIIAQNMMLRVIHHSCYSLADLRDYQLT